MKNVFILPVFNLRNNETTFEIVEAFETKYGFSHSESTIIDGFKSKNDAISYCFEFDYKIVNI